MDRLTDRLFASIFTFEQQKSTRTVNMNFSISLTCIKKIQSGFYLLVLSIKASTPEKESFHSSLFIYKPF